MSRIEALLPLLAKLIEVDGDVKNLVDLATEDGRSPYHLQKVFSAELGESPLRYRRRVRLQRAAASLLVTRKSILEIALDAGFDTHEGFSRAFRAMFYISPREFRKQRDLYRYLAQNYQTHLEVANQTAPCVRLYRVSLTQQKKGNSPKGGSNMNYEVSRKTITELAFLSIKRQVKQEAISDELGSMLVPVFQFATAQGILFAWSSNSSLPQFWTRSRYA